MCVYVCVYACVHVCVCMCVCVCVCMSLNVNAGVSVGKLHMYQQLKLHGLQINSGIETEAVWNPIC